MKKFISILLVVAMLATVFTACGKNESAEAPEKEAENPVASVAENKDVKDTTFGLKPFDETKNLTIALIAGSQTGIPVVTAIEKGFFEELNIEVEIETFNNGPAMMEASEDWDLGIAGVAGTLVGAIGYDLPAVGVCDRETNQVVFTRPNGPIAQDPTNPEVYKDTTWLLPMGTTAHYTLLKLMDSLGLSMENIKTVNMDVASAYTAFAGGEGDGMVIFNNLVFNAEDEGFVRIADSGSLNATNSACLTMTPDAIENKHDLMVTTWALFYMAADWCNASEENQKFAINAFLTACEDEGVNCSEDTIARTFKIWKCPSLSNSIETMTAEVDDEAGLYTSRKLLQIEKEILGTMDFFITQNAYTAENREYLLDNQLVVNSIAIDAAKMLTELGIKY